MGERTKIEWADSTWNPWHGCLKVSPGCKLCYMYQEKQRYGQDPRVVVRSRTTFGAPLRWREPRRIFTCSWSDFFIAEADAWRGDAWDIIRATPRHIYQVLTKRPERIADHLPPDWGAGWPHVWLLTSVENQDTANERIPALLRIKAAVHGVSYEPALGAVDFTRIRTESWAHGEMDALTGILAGEERPMVPRITWIIVGGESGPGARPMHPAWPRAVRDQCQAAGVPFFFKGWGGRTAKSGGRLLDGRTWEEYPDAAR